MSNVDAKPLARTGRRFLTGMAVLVLLDTLSWWVFDDYSSAYTPLYPDEKISLGVTLIRFAIGITYLQAKYIPLIVIGTILNKWSNASGGIERCFRYVCVIFGVGLLIWLIPFVVHNFDEVRYFQAATPRDPISVKVMVIMLLQLVLGVLVFPVIVIVHWIKYYMEQRESEQRSPQ